MVDKQCCACFRLACTETFKWSFFLNHAVYCLDDSLEKCLLNSDSSFQVALILWHYIITCSFTIAVAEEVCTDTHSWLLNTSTWKICMLFQVRVSLANTNHMAIVISTEHVPPNRTKSDSTVSSSHVMSSNIFLFRSFLPHQI